MTTIAANLVDMRNIDIHKIKLTVHVPVEQAALLHQVFGWPTLAEPVAVEISRSATESVAVSPLQATEQAPAAITPQPDTTAAGAPSTESRTDLINRCDRQLADAAQHGTVALRAVWDRLPRDVRVTLKAALDRRHKLTAIEVDRAGEG